MRSKGGRGSEGCSNCKLELAYLERTSIRLSKVSAAYTMRFWVHAHQRFLGSSSRDVSMAVTKVAAYGILCR